MRQRQKGQPRRPICEKGSDRCRSFDVPSVENRRRRVIRKAALARGAAPKRSRRFFERGALWARLNAASVMPRIRAMADVPAFHRTAKPFRRPYVSAEPTFANVAPANVRAARVSKNGEARHFTPIAMPPLLYADQVRFQSASARCGAQLGQQTRGCTGRWDAMMRSGGAFWDAAMSPK